MIKKHIKEYRRRIRRKIYESIGSDRYSKPALHDIDRKLEKYLSYREGFFVEAGANDGYTQSNTYYLERLLGWQGILIEPIPELFHRCRKERKNSRIFNCALVSDSFHGSHIEMHYSGLMSIVSGSLKSENEDTKHVGEGSLIQKVDSYNISVPVRTLTSIFDECNVTYIDLLSLDVEGYELSVLQGLDFDRYQPKFMLIEARFRQEIDDHISKLYYALTEFSEYDILYTLKD